MTSPRLIAFRPEHLLAFRNRDTWTPIAWSLAQEKASGPIAFTAVADEGILGCAGLMIPWPGVGLAWMDLAEAVCRYPVWMTRIVRQVLDDATRSYGLHRIEAVVRVDNVRNQRWIEALGFVRENGCARAYTPDRVDGLRYERVEC